MIPEGLTEPEVLVGQYPFVDAQAVLGEGTEESVGVFTVGWHDTSVQPYRGCFAVVSDAQADLADLVGDVICVHARGEEVYVYVLGRADVPHTISLARRAFLAVSGLWRDDVQGSVWRVT